MPLLLHDRVTTRSATKTGSEGLGPVDIGDAELETNFCQEFLPGDLFLTLFSRELLLAVFEEILALLSILSGIRIVDERELWSLTGSHCIHCGSGTGQRFHKCDMLGDQAIHIVEIVIHIVDDQAQLAGGVLGLVVDKRCSFDLI